MKIFIFLFSSSVGSGSKTQRQRDVEMRKTRLRLKNYVHFYEHFSGVSFRSFGFILISFSFRVGLARNYSFTS